MTTKVFSALLGVNGCAKVKIETAKTSTSLPRISLLGVPASEARASKERILTACRQSGIRLPHAKITINFQSQAKITKLSGLEFALAVSLMQIHDLIPKQDYLALGSLSLDGKIEPVDGHYAALQSLADDSIEPIWTPSLYLPVGCQPSWKNELNIVNNLTKFIACATGKQKLGKFCFGSYNSDSPKFEQLPQLLSPSLVSCLQLVLAGGHHCLLLGTPGVGKTHAKLILSTLLPPLSPEEALERQLTLTSSDWSPELQRVVTPCAGITRTLLLGSLHQRGLVSSLAHGILFLDELPSFRRECLESLRPLLDPDSPKTQLADQKEPSLEPGNTNNFCAVATANPCPCGFWGLPQCQCAPADVERYLQRFSGALRDRFDLTWRVSDLDARPFKQEDWQAYFQTLLAARQKQRARVSSGYAAYARLYSWPQLLELAPSKLVSYLERQKKKISWRKLLQQVRVACTMADLQNEQLDQSYYELAGMYVQSK